MDASVSSFTMEVSPLNDTKYTTPGVPSLDGEETARLHRAKGPLRKAQKRKRAPQALRSKIPSLPLSLTSETLLWKLLQTKKENPQAFLLKGSPFENGGYLLSHFYAVPSAWLGLTSLFGMGRGGTPTL